MSVLCMLLFLGIGAFSKDIPTFGKYFVNATRYQANAKIIITYYIHSDIGKGVGNEFFGGGDVYSVYRTIDEDPDESYFIMDIETQHSVVCMIEEISLDEVDVIGHQSTIQKSYLGEKDCSNRILAPQSCDVWELTTGSSYFALVESGRPVKMVDAEGQLIFEFLEFKEGDSSFVDKVQFELPVDPDTCIKE